MRIEPPVNNEGLLSFTVRALKGDLSPVEVWGMDRGKRILIALKFKSNARDVDWRVSAEARKTKPPGYIVGEARRRCVYAFGMPVIANAWAEWVQSSFDSKANRHLPRAKLTGETTRRERVEVWVPSAHCIEVACVDRGGLRVSVYGGAKRICPPPLCVSMSPFLPSQRPHWSPIVCPATDEAASRKAKMISEKGPVAPCVAIPLVRMMCLRLYCWYRLCLSTLRSIPATQSVTQTLFALGETAFWRRGALPRAWLERTLSALSARIDSRACWARRCPASSGWPTAS